MLQLLYVFDIGDKHNMRRHKQKGSKIDTAPSPPHAPASRKAVPFTLHMDCRCKRVLLKHCCRGTSMRGQGFTAMSTKSHGLAKFLLLLLLLRQLVAVNDNISQAAKKTHINCGVYTRNSVEGGARI